MTTLTKAGISASAIQVTPEPVQPAAQMGKQRQEEEELVVGPGVVVPGPGSKAALAGAVWGGALGALAGLIIGLILYRDSVLGVVIVAIVCGGTAGVVFGGFWAGAARADEEAEKTELIEKRATAVSVAADDRAEILRAVRELQRLSPDHIVVTDENGRPVDDESDEALWMREA